VQEKFIVIAEKQLDLLRRVLRSSSSDEHRAIAAWIIPFTKNKKDIIPDLLYAVHDPDQVVRNNAARALSVLARYAADNPLAGISIPIKPFIDMIHSILWTDRNKGAAVLEALTKNKDNILLNELSQQALQPLTEMAKWKDPGHAAFAFLILGRMAGISDKEMSDNLYSDAKNSFVDSLIVAIKAK
jgi:hypothetical protein